MNNLPLFDKPQKITSQFDTHSDIVLYHGDVNDFVETLPDNSVKLIITSPPYNLGKEYEDRVSIEQYLAIQTQTIAKFDRILKPEGSICWQVGNFVEKGEVFPLDIYYYPIFKELGFFLRNRIVWHFGHGLHTKKRFSGRYETVLWFTKSNKYTFNLDLVRIPSKYPGKRHYKGPNKGKPSGNPKGKNPSDVWEILSQEWEECLWDIPNVKSNHPEKTIHPCQFPVELVERFVLALTNEDDWVFDPYSGVGSALIAAVKRGRRAMGSEQEGAYVSLAHERIQSFLDGTLRTRPLGKPVYKPTGKEKVSQRPQEWTQVTQSRLLEEQEKYE
ncbi:MAG: site-specific DNA-methyltransferase [Ardenticatenaceae bacterium]|nr:site-specific DNA-methyltransferase [Ardenticatenaceae bacterium]MCB9442966.1 site-specific DNA-methyltransferase [Ardenticatenaceae bacterium]